MGWDEMVLLVLMNAAGCRVVGLAMEGHWALDIRRTQKGWEKRGPFIGWFGSSMVVKVLQCTNGA